MIGDQLNSVEQRRGRFSSLLFLRDMIQHRHIQPVNRIMEMANAFRFFAEVVERRNEGAFAFLMFRVA